MDGQTGDGWTDKGIDGPGDGCDTAQSCTQRGTTDAQGQSRPIPQLHRARTFCTVL